MPSLNPAKPAQLLTAACLLSLGWGALKCSRSYAFSQSSTVRLAFCTCTPTICKGLHLPPTGAHTRSQLQGCGGEACKALGMPVGAGRGICRQDIPSSSWTVLLTESIKQLLGSMLLWWVPSPSFYARSISQPLRHADHLSSLGGVRKKWTSLATSCTVGKARSLPLYSHFPPWEKSQSKGIPLGTELCHLGGGVTLVKWKFLLTLSVHLFLRVFAPKVCSHRNAQTPTKVLLSMGDWQNLCSGWGVAVENSYSFILLISLPTNS